MNGKISQWLATEWARQIGPALSSMTGEPFQASAADKDAEPAPPDAFVIAKRLREEPAARMRLAFSPELWRSAGEAVLRAAGIPDASEDELRNAFLEVVNQSLGQLAAWLGQRLGREVSWEDDPEDAAGDLPPAGAAVTVEGPAGPLGMAWVAAGPGFVAEVPPGEADASPAPQPLRADPGEPCRRPMLDLLLEVELPVGVTFGRAQMKLKDAIKLTSGSIVELNRTIIEPVEVIVNNCVIARGEVVVIEGNYGVRIQEIVSREERLRTLF